MKTAAMLVWLCAACCGAQTNVTGVVIDTDGRSEPHYHLMALSSWLAKYGDGPGNYKPSPEADLALRQIGSNAVPYLLHLLHSTNSHSRYTFILNADKTPRGLTRPLTPAASGFGGRLKAWSVGMESRFQQVTIPASWDHWKAYLAFQALGAEGKAAIPDLVKLAGNPDGDSNPPLISFWKDNENVSTFVATRPPYLPSSRPVFSAASSRGYWGFGPGAFLPDGEIAAWSLAFIGTEGVPPLTGLLTNSNPQIRCRAAVALGLAGKSAEPAVPALLNALHDSDKNTRRKAADALGCIGQQPDLVVPVLIKLLLFDNPDMEDVAAAALALGCIGQRPDLIVPALTRLFDYPDMEDIAAKALGDFRDRATNAIPALLTLFQAEYTALNQARGEYRSDDIALALNNISPEVARKEIIPRLIDRIHHGSPWSQSMTLNTLAKMTNQPDLVMPVLLEALDRPDIRPYYTRHQAAYDLGRFGSAATSAIPRLISLSTSQDTNLCRLATNALDKIDPGWRNHR
jgi:HEAT repeat protein